MPFRRSFLVCFALALVAAADSQKVEGALGWPTHGGNSAHTAISGTKAQPLRRVVWSTPLDLDPQYNGDVLYAHYGSPIVTRDNVVLLPVKTGANGGFRIEARKGDTGGLLWQEDTDYVVPEHSWFPTLGPTLTGGSVAWARKAGIVALKDLRRGTITSVCFYGQANYDANPAAYDAAVKITSPLSVDEEGMVYFTYRVEGTTPLGLKGGLAVIRPNGGASYVEGAAATGDANFFRPKLNAAPGLYRGVVYVVFKNSGSAGMLVGLVAKSLTPLYKTALLDPKTGNPSTVDDEGTACPTIGTDGDVYYGVLENPFGTHHYRGWLLHFDRTLAQTKTPGSFGWDDSPSIVPSSIVPSYTGSSPYLVMTKYNDYAGAGDGVNRIGLLDPNATQIDPFSGVASMKEVLTKVGPTPDATHTGSYPNAVREWCINTAAVDVSSGSVLVNNEDGILYRWNLATNALDQSVQIATGIGQAYTPTVIGTSGLVFAVSNARLFAVGS